MKMRNSFGRELALMALVTGAAIGAAQAQDAAPGTGEAPKKTKAAKPKTPRVRGTAYARVLHAVADGPAVDVYVDDQKVLTNVAYKTLSDYLPVPSGKRTFKITATGKTDALLTTAATQTKDKFYTVAAYGTLAKPALLRVNESTGKEVEGKARIYIVHLAEGAPAVDITAPSTRAKAGFASVMKNVTYGKSRLKTATPGTMTLQVRAGGKVVKEQAGVKTEAGKRYTVVVVGNAGATGAQALDLIVTPAATK